MTFLNRRLIVQYFRIEKSMLLSFYMESIWKDHYIYEKKIYIPTILKTLRLPHVIILEDPNDICEFQQSLQWLEFHEAKCRQQNTSDYLT